VDGQSRNKKKNVVVGTPTEAAAAPISGYAGPKTTLESFRGQNMSKNRYRGIMYMTGIAGGWWYVGGGKGKLEHGRARARGAACGRAVGGQLKLRKMSTKRGVGRNINTGAPALGKYNQEIVSQFLAFCKVVA